MATINVNLKKCQCSSLMLAQYVPGREDVRNGHHVACPGAPILLPCRLPPSFTCEVVLGECDCGGVESMSGRGGIGHEAQCPARPIRVSASITNPDGSWEKSEVKDAMRVGAMGREYHIPTDDLLQNAARARWEIVKALVLNTHHVYFTPTERALADQRNAVFAALAEMARAEDVAFTAQVELDKACMVRAFSDVQGVSSEPAERPSTDYLYAYVAHLIEQAGVLS